MKTRERSVSAKVTVGESAWLLDAYRRMCEIRLFEEGMQSLFLKGEIHGTTHLSAGQEAVPVGVCAALEPDDYAAGTYRGHGHALAKGTGLRELAAEMLGRSSGVCGGRAGSMNVIDRQHGLVGCFGIIGGSAGAGVGAALAGKRQGRVAVAFFGDGATNHGYLHECLNFAKVHSLPLVFVCENNLYGEFTPWLQVTAGGDIAGRVAAYGMPASKIDGNDVLAVHAAAAEAVSRAREQHEPSFLECLTYRHYGHSRSDPATYRSEQELASWKERDPLIVTQASLRELGTPDEHVAAAAEQARENVAAALQAAREAPFPDPLLDTASEFRA